ncbi:MAG: ATP phosphoribosyltransferase regulatory subunit, partial [Bacillota bacterium]
EPPEAAFKLIGEEGEVLALRADMTAPIAQMAATEWQNVPRPLRLAYCGRVFRRGEEMFGARELQQAGVEMIGVGGPEADAEVVAVACEALRQSGVDRFQVSLGHNGLLRELLAGLDLEEDDRDALREALIRRDLVVAGRVLGSACEQDRSLVRALSPFGSEKGLAAVSSVGVELPGLEKLATVIEVLEAYGLGDHLRVDVALARGFDYYTGVVFEVYCPRSGVMLGGGGRYDGLTGVFGCPEAATGFALDLGRVLSSLSPGTGVEADKWLVVGSREEREEVLACARRLRASGYRACVHWADPEPSAPPEVIAGKMGFSGAALVLSRGEAEFRRAPEGRLREP